jgi:hypothetical protein
MVFMKKYFKVIGVGIFFILIFFYFFYERTVPISHPFFRTGDHYSKNIFNVFYEVTAGRACSNCSSYDKKRIIKDADPKTFEVLNRHYTKDKNNFYICSWSGLDLFRISTKCEKIKNVDRESFKPLDEGYARDKNYIYFYGNIIENGDSESFKILDNGYRIDKNRVYYENRRGLYIIKEIESNFNVDAFLQKDHTSFEEELRTRLEPIINGKKLTPIIDAFIK